MNLVLFQIRFGFAAEAYPRKILPTEVILSSNGKTKYLFDYADKLEFYDQMVDFLQTIFFKYVLCGIVFFPRVLISVKIVFILGTYW